MRWSRPVTSPPSWGRRNGPLSSTATRFPRVAGFGTESLLASFYSVLPQLKTGERFLDNCYREVAHPGRQFHCAANADQTLDIVDANWRGIASFPFGLCRWKSYLRQTLTHACYSRPQRSHRRRAGEMPPGCDCAQVVLGKILPQPVPHLRQGLHPAQPGGALHVSSEGACRIWWAGLCARSRRCLSASRSAFRSAAGAGVGFRPFVLSSCVSALSITGWVRNVNGAVEIQAEGSSRATPAFQQCFAE